MRPDRVSNPGPLIYESGALPIVLRGPASRMLKCQQLLAFKHLGAGKISFKDYVSLKKAESLDIFTLMSI